MFVDANPKPWRVRTAPGAILLSLSAALSACGPAPQVRPGTPTPEAAPQPSTEVLIMPLGQKTQQELPYWTSEANRLVLAYFDIFLRHGFEGATSSQVKVANEEFEGDSLEFEYRDMGQGGDSHWWSYVPVSGRVAHSGSYPDFVLIFDGLRFRIRNGSGSRQTYDVPGAGKAEVDLEYVLWDNRTQEVAASGLLHEEVYTSSPNPSNEMFKALFGRLADEVVRNSPLSS